MQYLFLGISMLPGSKIQENRLLNLQYEIRNNSLIV